MDEFRISLGPQQQPWTICFNGGNSIAMDLDEYNEIADGKLRPLVLLALLTEWKRSEGNGKKDILRRRADELCPSLKNNNPEGSRSLSNAVCDKRSYETRVAKNRDHWLKKIFGEWPLGRFLDANKHFGDSAFRPNVKIVIEDDSGLVIDDDPNLKKELYYLYEKKKTPLERKVGIEFHLESNGECQPTIIETNTCKGSFRTTAKFWIRVVADFKTNFHLFWISPDESYIIFPPFEPSLTPKPDLFVNSSELRIGKRDNIIIAPPTGTQTCVLLINKKPIGDELCRSILADIEACIPSKLRRGRLEEPVLTKDILVLILDSLAVMPAGRQVRWQDRLVDRLARYGGILYVFSVPHK